MPKRKKGRKDKQRRRAAPFPRERETEIEKKIENFQTVERRMCVRERVKKRR